MADSSIKLELAGREVVVTNPEKVFFPERGYTKLDLVSYYLSVADGALRGVRDRPMVLKRFVNGATGEPFFQKRAPAIRPAWLRTARIRFPSGRSADLLVCNDVADLGWIRFSGTLAWLSWLFLHIFMLIGFRNRAVVVFQWAVAYFTFQRSVRLITDVDRSGRS